MTLEEYQQRFMIRKLGKDESVPEFDCGDEDLNDFILHDASVYHDTLLAVTYVLQEKDTHKVTAFFSLANDRISIQDFPSGTDFNRFRKFRFVQKKRIKSYPAAKICRLGIDNSIKGQSVGSYLLSFIKTFFLADNRTGCRFLTVDAYNDAISFYLKNGFDYLSATEKESQTQFLYFDLGDI